MDSLHIARLEFALTASLHFLFVATILGLAPVAAWLASRHAATGRPELGRARDYLVRLYLINYGIGIVSGMMLELQTGLGWAGDGTAIYGPVATALAVETVLAFFLESTLVGLFLVSGGRFPEWLRAGLLWGIALTAWVSAVVVVSANAFLHRPVGVEVSPDGTAHVTDLTALLTNPSAVTAWVHILGAAGIVAGFWLAAGGARLTLQGLDPEVARLLLRRGAVLVACSAPLAVASGLTQFAHARRGLVGDGPGVFGILLALMMLAGALILLTSWMVVLPLVLTGRAMRSPVVLRVLATSAWIPLMISVAGWVYREEARQPWFVVGHVTVAEAASLQGPALVASATAFTVVAFAAAVLNFRFMGQALRRDPARAGVLA